MTHPAHSSRRSGFSLVELSIVLVILGLLVGGVLSGQSLIRAAELRSVTTQYQQFSTAIGSFKDKYFAIPGDMSNAVSFWGNTVTGNGDGDGRIENTATAIGAAAATTSNEISNFWQHLASAQMVEGSYTVVAGTIMTAGTNNPKGKLSSSGWNVIGLGTVGFDSSAADTGTTDPAIATFFDGDYGNAFLLGAGTAALLPTGVLKGEEAWNIDTKMDDGRPATGSVTSQESQATAAAGGGCSSPVTQSASTLSASVYELTSTSTTACSLVFKSGY